MNTTSLTSPIPGFQVIKGKYQLNQTTQTKFFEVPQNALEGEKVFAIPLDIVEKMGNTFVGYQQDPDGRGVQPVRFTTLA